MILNEALQPNKGRMAVVYDISYSISSTIKLFANDTKVYREIADSINDTQALQSDIDHLANWATL